MYCIPASFLHFIGGAVRWLGERKYPSRMRSLVNIMRHVYEEKMDNSMVSNMIAEVDEDDWEDLLTQTCANYGETILHAAVKMEQIELVSLIVNRRQDFELLARLLVKGDDGGRSVLQLALSKDNPELLMQLLKYTNHSQRSRLSELIFHDNCQHEMQLISQKVISSLFPFGDEYLIPFRGKMKRLALIYWNSRSDYMLRSGADQEERTLAKALDELGFRVVTRKDWTAEQLRGYMHRDISTHGDSLSCLFVCVMSHGSFGNIQDKDGVYMNMNEIIKPMSNLRSPIPKILLLQCCRGTRVEHKKTYHLFPRARLDCSDPHDAGKRNVGSYDIHLTESDMCVIISTLWGQVSLRNLFIPTFASALVNGSKQGADLYEIFLETCKMMNSSKLRDTKDDPVIDYGVQQVPLIMSTLRKSLCIRKAPLPARRSRCISM